MATKTSTQSTVTKIESTVSGALSSSPVGAATTTTTTTTTNTSTISTTPGIKIKNEIANDEIKDFAETAMNELLGWFGYDNVDSSTKSLSTSSATSRLMKRHLHTTNSLQNNSDLNFNGHKTTSTNHNHNHKDDSTTSDRDSSRENSKSPCSIKTNENLESICSWCRRIVPENSPDFLTTTDGPRYCSESCFAQSRRASFKRAKQCDWCRHIRHAVSYVDFQDGASQLQFCSDKCLNQYKMQIFCKETQAHLDMNPHLKDKLDDSGNCGSLITPDLWLKNCRSRSVSPVSESGSPNICTDSHFHQQQQQSIINQKQQHQQQQQQQQNRLRSNSPTNQQNVHKPIISVAPVSKLMSKNLSTSSSGATSVASVLNSRQFKHGGRKKRIGGLSRSNLMQTMNNNCNQNNSNTISSNSNNNINNNNNNLIINNNSGNKSNKILFNSLNSSNPVALKKNYPSVTTPPLNQLQNVQDLRLNVPPLSPNDHQPNHHHHPMSRHNLVGPPPPSHPTTNYYSRLSGAKRLPPSHQQIRSPFLSPPPPSQSNANQYNLHNRMTNDITQMNQLHPQHLLSQLHQQGQFMPNIIHNDMMNPLSALIGTTPPVTMIIPYPIIIPLPVPIPIPLPVNDFLLAAPNLSTSSGESTSNSKDSTNQKRTTTMESSLNTANTSNTKGEERSPASSGDDGVLSDENSSFLNDEPLDFTKTKTKTATETVIDHSKSYNKHDDETTFDDGKEQISIRNSSNDNPKTSNDGHNLSEDDVKQKIPKFKITRLHSKRLSSSTKESECSRPLRKRKRIIDCYVTTPRCDATDDCTNSKK